MTITEQEGGVVLEDPALKIVRKIRDLYASGEIYWIQDEYYDGMSGYCILGAIHAFSENIECRVFHLVDSHFYTQYDEPAIEWNDTVARNVNDVVAELDKILDESK